MLTSSAEPTPVTPEPLGPAAVMWNDFVGSAAADEVRWGPHGGLYELAGLDPDAWMILGVDLVLNGENEHARVYALDKHAQHVAGHEDLLELAYNDGELTVDAFEIEPDSARRFRDMFNTVAIRLIARGVSDQRLVVRSR